MNNRLLIALVALCAVSAVSAAPEGKSAHRGEHHPKEKIVAPEPQQAASGAAQERARAKMSKERVSKAGACRQQAADQKLTGVEYKQAMVACMNK